MSQFSGYPVQQSNAPLARGREPDSLADVLDRVLDKGVVIAGDIRISLLDIELLTIKVRLLIASADKAKELGIDWWTRDAALSSSAHDKKQVDAERENEELRRRVEQLESRLNNLLTDGRGAERRHGQAPERAQRADRADRAERRGAGR